MLDKSKQKNNKAEGIQQADLLDDLVCDKKEVRGTFFATKMEKRKRSYTRPSIWNFCRNGDIIKGKPNDRGATRCFFGYALNLAGDVLRIIKMRTNEALEKRCIIILNKVYC